MKKLFEEYGGVIVTAIAIVALIGVVGILMGGEDGGVVGKSLQRQVSSLTGGSDGTVDDSVSGSVPPSGSGIKPSVSYTLEEIEDNEHLYAIGSTKPEYVVVVFNEDYSVANVQKNGVESDGVIRDYYGYDDGSDYSPLTIHSSTLKKVNFKEGITVIGQATCLENKNLTTVSLPDSLKAIGAQAFFDCPNLNGVSIPDGVNQIDMGAFAWCSSLSSINLPASLTAIEYGIFIDCVSLTHIEIPNGVVSIDDYAFGDCDGLTSIIIPDSVTSIHDDAFGGCPNLKTIKGTAGSYAETFAESRGYTFVAV